MTHADIPVAVSEVDTKRGVSWDMSFDSLVTSFPTPGPSEYNVDPNLEHRDSITLESSPKKHHDYPKEFSKQVVAGPKFATGVLPHAPRSDETRSGRVWAIALGALLSSRAALNIVAALHLAANVVDAMVPSELEQARLDFQAAVKEVRAMCPSIFDSSVERLVISVASKFKPEATSSLPKHVVQYMMSFLPLCENGVLCSVSKNFQDAAGTDCLWRGAFCQRFCWRQESDDCPPPPVAAITRRDNCRTGHIKVPSGVIDEATTSGGYKERFMRRLLDPQVGDRVEVAWRGKFRLESLEVYNGMAWWRAEVVGRGKVPGSYQVHYPGWENRWDEWVTRDRLRWGNERRANALRGVSAAVGDSIEMWCEGIHVPGAWLEAVVQGVEDGRLNLGRMLTSGQFWVDESDVRLVKKKCTGEEFRSAEGIGRLAWVNRRSGMRGDRGRPVPVGCWGHHRRQSFSGSGRCGVM